MSRAWRFEGDFAHKPGRHTGCCCSGGSRGPLDQPEALARQVGPREGLLTPAGRICLAVCKHFRQAHPHLCLKQFLQTQEKGVTSCAWGRLPTAMQSLCTVGAASRLQNIAAPRYVIGYMRQGSWTHWAKALNRLLLRFSKAQAQSSAETSWVHIFVF